VATSASASAQTGSISGRVTDATTSANVSGVAVEVYTASGVYRAVSVSVADGTFSVSGLPTGTYFARTGGANTVNYIDQLYSGIACFRSYLDWSSCPVTSGTPITVTAGATTSNINFALATGGTTSGRVTDALTGANLSGISVNLYNASGLFLGQSSSAAGGTFSVGGLPTGTYFAGAVAGSTNYFDQLYSGI
jgi:hypothetical protein